MSTSGDKNKRANFTTVERNLAVNIIDKYKGIIEDKSTKTDMRVEKKEAWEAIAAEFNRSSLITAKVTSEQVKKLWQKLKAEYRQDKASNTREVFRTGGGPNATTPQVDAAIAAAAAPYLLHPIIGALDSDNVHLGRRRAAQSLRRNLNAPAAAGRPGLTDPRLSSTSRAATPSPMPPALPKLPRSSSAANQQAPQLTIAQTFAALLPSRASPPPSDESEDEDTLTQTTPSPSGSLPTRRRPSPMQRASATPSRRSTVNSSGDEQSRASSAQTTRSRRRRPYRSPLEIRTEKQARMKFIVDENRRREEQHAVSLDNSERVTDTEIRHKEALYAIELQSKKR